MQKEKTQLVGMQIAEISINVQMVIKVYSTLFCSCFMCLI